MYTEDTGLQDAEGLQGLSVVKSEGKAHTYETGVIALGEGDASFPKPCLKKCIGGVI